MTLFLLLGLVGVFVIIMLRKAIVLMQGNNNKLVRMLQHTKWYQQHWFGGGFLFIVNVVLFTGVGLVLHLITQLSIPFIHLLIMIGAVITSIVLWVSMNRGWQGSKKNRLKMGFLGSSFYMVLALYIVYKLITLEPSFPGDDTFMAFIGLLFGLIVAIVAFITCMIFTGLSYQNKSQ
ncbi:hypothetical protein [Ammoniphilus sp. CFH 90114]|uniref:hypothetical protein n=1 Tax=Ammoniphilus sp. CFH 90114 TaxID=2493665 RepID=UPI00100E67DD|nr:hypothetical protein [Ammoniphilus sp. CFH 90114]RXT07112.1 hypothetical protein EIZ39_13265 [Ammoniphilus sp. CFH 90114]